MKHADERGGYRQTHDRTRQTPQTRYSRSSHDDGERQRAQRGGHQVKVGKRADRAEQFLVKMLTGDAVQPEEVLPLAGPDDHRDAGGETDDHRVGNELDDRTQPRRAEQREDHAGEHRRDLQAGHAVLGGDARENDDERAGGSGDLNAAAAEDRYQQSRDDRGVDALLGFCAGGDCERHCQRQRNDADDGARDDVARPMFAAQKTGAMGFEQRDHIAVEIPGLKQRS